MRNKVQQCTSHVEKCEINPHVGISDPYLDLFGIKQSKGDKGRVKGSRALELSSADDSISLASPLAPPTIP